jgi:hypothetical protein
MATDIVCGSSPVALAASKLGMAGAVIIELFEGEIAGRAGQGLERIELAGLHHIASLGFD